MAHLSCRRFLRGSLALGGLGMLSACGVLPPQAQPPAKVSRIGFLLISPSQAAPSVEAFRDALRERGYTEGRNIAFELRYAEGRVEPLPDLADELVRLEVDVIVTQGTPAARAAKNATNTIPIVLAAALDPVQTGLVASFAQPGGNLTGVTSTIPELSGKSLELLRAIVPSVARAAVLWNPNNPAQALQLRETEVAAQAFGVQIQSLGVRDADELESALAAIIKERPHALLVANDPLFLAHRERIADFVAQHRLPAMYERRDHVDAGGLMSYGVNFPDNFRRAAGFVDKILKGAKPADLPIEQPTKFELVINLKTAQALGLTIPQSVLAQATEVIQ